LFGTNAHYHGAAGYDLQEDERKQTILGMKQSFRRGIAVPKQDVHLLTTTSTNENLQASRDTTVTLGVIGTDSIKEIQITIREISTAL
jgi:hypothetical protein